jgi:hypothetical protein
MAGGGATAGMVGSRAGMRGGVLVSENMVARQPIQPFRWAAAPAANRLDTFSRAMMAVM